MQADYETRRVYASLKSDLYESSEFSHRIDTLQLGLPPMSTTTTVSRHWLLVQGRRITGEISEGTETAFLLRVFKGAVWVEAGATTDGKLQAMFMINF